MQASKSAASLACIPETILSLLVILAYLAGEFRSEFRQDTFGIGSGAALLLPIL
jgi:hypothetical protein